MKIKGGNEIVESIEASGKSVDEAILQALSRLGRRRDEVDVTVLQEPSRGAFGIGSKDARVRVTLRSANVGAIITPEMADALLGPDDSFPEEGPYVEDEDEEEDFGDEEEEEEFDEEDMEEEEEEPALFYSSATISPELASEFGAGDVSVAEGEMREVDIPSRDAA